ncbi:MAG: serine hydrolase, partial [Pseudomonadota bacterium]
MGARVRGVFFVALTLIGLAVGGAPTAQASKYAAVVMDANSGKILFARNSTARRYPASLTKVMTLYMTFEALERGDLTLHEKLTVSRRAAGQPPSKIGLRAGQTITVEQAIKALVTKSANDVATVLAEKLGGSEYKFALKMTKKAKSLGMTRTRFMNASGLPHSKQVSTARDLAKMAQAVMDDYPQYYHYFSVRRFTWKGRTYTSHNRLLRNYSGTDGIKTGYTRASGCNLTTSVKRDGYHLIGVVLGGRTSASRDSHMREILNRQFTRIARNPSLIPRYAHAPAPRRKPGKAYVVARYADLMPPRKPGSEPQVPPALAPETPGPTGAPVAVASLGAAPTNGLGQSAGSAPRDPSRDAIEQLLSDLEGPAPRLKPLPATVRPADGGQPVLASTGSDPIGDLAATLPQKAVAGTD